MLVISGAPGQLTWLYSLSEFRRRRSVFIMGLTTLHTTSARVMRARGTHDVIAITSMSAARGKAKASLVPRPCAFVAGSTKFAQSAWVVHPVTNTMLLSLRQSFRQ